MNGAYMNNTDNNLFKGDTGLLSQVVGAADNDADGNTVGVVDVNKDGKVDNNDILKYDLNNQAIVRSGYGAAGTMSQAIKDAIEKDYQSGLAQGSAVKGYSTTHGYNAIQWNEYIGEKLFTVSSDKFLTA